MSVQVAQDTRHAWVESFVAELRQLAGPHAIPEPAAAVEAAPVSVDALREIAALRSRIAVLEAELARYTVPAELGPPLDLDDPEVLAELCAGDLDCAVGSLDADCYTVEEYERQAGGRPSRAKVEAALYDCAWRKGYVSPATLAGELADDPNFELAEQVRTICQEDPAFEDDGAGQSIEERFLYHEVGAAVDAGIKPGDVPGDARSGWRYEIGHALYRRAAGQMRGRNPWADYAAPVTESNGREYDIAVKHHERAKKAAATRWWNRQALAGGGQ